MIEQLREKVYKALENVEVKKVGVAFSGGVDSSLLAKACKDLGKNVTLLTVGFLSDTDIKASKEVSREMGLNLVHESIPLEELEDGLRTVLATIEFDRIVRLENCVSFYYVFRLASRQKLDTVLSANGIDELFCGYQVYKKAFGDDRTMRNLMETLVETAKKDKSELDKIAALFDIEYICPFLSDSFVSFAMNIPLEFKIKGKDDEMRKHALRETALEIGVPLSAALRAKKAFQYSSGINKAIRELARTKGFIRKAARAAGFRSEREAYFETLTAQGLGKLG